MRQLRFPGESTDHRRARMLRERVDDLRTARQRIIAAADEERRRIERDLHDGAQQRLVSEALTNVAKYAHATEASVTLCLDADTLRVEVRDDGVGGADMSTGTGLCGLRDRGDAL